MYVKAKDAQRKLGVASSTLRRWADTGIIKSVRTENGMRLYDVDEYIELHSNEHERRQETRKSYIYARVSSFKQKEDLERQADFLKEKHPDHEVIKEIASGINFKRKGLQKILAETLKGNVKEVVVSYKDRLCRIAYEHFRWLFEQYGVNIVVEDNAEYSPEEELGNDLMSILHVFSSRHYGLRRAVKKCRAKKEENTVNKQEE